MPSLGFLPACSIEFDHDSEAGGLPFTNIWGNILRLLVLNNDETFKESMLAAISYGHYFTSA